MIARRFTIVVRGGTESAYEDARREALRLISEDFLAGANSNDEGAFYFDSTDNVPANELPA